MHFFDASKPKSTVILIVFDVCKGRFYIPPPAFFHFLPFGGVKIIPNLLFVGFETGTELDDPVSLPLFALRCIGATPTAQALVNPDLDRVAIGITLNGLLFKR